MSKLRDRTEAENERRMLPYAVEFLKFFLAFIVIVTVALLTLRLAVSVG